MLKFILIIISLPVLERGYFTLARRLGIVDRPNARSSHTHVTIRGGGVIFTLGVWLYFLFLGFRYPWFLAGLTAIAGISLADDIRPVPNRFRLAVHFIAILLLFQELGILSLSAWWMLLAGLVLCVGIINAYNFMDGINGITGGYSLAVLLPLCYLNRTLGFVNDGLPWVVAASVVVFCLYNFRRRATCFAGDVGSVGIAFILLFLLGRLILRTGDLSYILFLALYGVDSVLTICHRILLRENLGKAHRKHAYQLMANELRIPHVTVSLGYAVAQLSISFGLILLPTGWHWAYASVVVALLCVAYVWFMRRYYYLHEEYLRNIHNETT